MVKATSTAPIERATETTWHVWLAFFDEQGAAQLSHKEIAVLAYDRIVSLRLKTENTWWWAQNVAIAYEQHVGLRLPGQGSDGNFQVSTSKTFAGTMDEARERWVQLMTGREELSGVGITGEPSLTESEKWRYWRCGLDDGSRIALDIYQKSADKAVLGVQHSKLESLEAVEYWRSFWKAELKNL